MRRPPALRPGMAIGIAAPGSPFSDEPFENGCALLRSAGHPLVFREDIRARHRYLAGDDDRRARELTDLFSDPGIGAIFAARGGYGAPRLLDRLDPRVIIRHPKPLVGFSDVTALHAFLGVSCGLTSVHGPLLTTLAEEPEESLEHLFRLLAGEISGARLPAREVLVPGRVTGRLVGGCLSLLASLVGTPYFPDLDGAILFIEEVGERPYRIDRMLTQLRLAGVLRGVRGVVVGHLKECDPPEGDGYTVLDLVLEEFGRTHVPIVAGLSAGHFHPNWALPLGSRVTLDAGHAAHGEAGALVLEEEAVER